MFFLFFQAAKAGDFDNIDPTNDHHLQTFARSDLTSPVHCDSQLGGDSKAIGHQHHHSPYIGGV